MPTACITEADAQAVLLVRALEESDREGLLRLEPVPMAESGPPARRVADRARALLGPLDSRLPFLPTLRRVTRLGAGWGWPVAAGALLIGVSTSALGSGREVNLLSVPVLGVLAWNLVIYALVVLGWLGVSRFESGLTRRLPGLAVDGYARRLAKRIGGHLPEGTVALVGRAVRHFLQAWQPAVRPLVEARARRLFHLAAAALAGGLVAGMYLRGLAFEYRATWESTFLGPEATQVFLTAVLSPARWLLPLELPPLTDLRSPSSGPAAAWIHLLALTLGLFVILPRALLAGVETVRTRWLARRMNLDLDAAYYRRLLASGPIRILLQPYSFSPSAQARDRLVAMLRDQYGERAELSWREPLEYGIESVPELDEDVEVAWLIFNLAQTPETEVQGELLASAPGPWRGLVDETAYSERFGRSAPDRVASRRKAWVRALGGSPGDVASVDLERATEEEIARALDHRRG